MSGLSIDLGKLFHGVGPFPFALTDAIVEVAYLAMAADSTLRDEEIAMFGRLAALLRGGPELSDRELRHLLDRFSGKLDRDDTVTRLHRAAESLRANPEAALAAYRAACVMAFSDLDSADGEFEFDLDLIAALHLSQEQADAEMDIVQSALIVPL